MSDTMNTPLDIVNRALQILGAKRVASLDSPTTAAEEMNAVYALKRDCLIRTRNWSCCIKSGTAILVNETPDNGYLYKYKLPNDCLKLLSVGNQYTGYSGVEGQFSSNPEWKLSRDYLYTNRAAPLPIEYCFRNVNVSTYDPLFCEVLAFELAIATANKITETQTNIATLEHLRDNVLNDAVLCNAIELPNEPNADGNWIAAREEWE